MTALAAISMALGACADGDTASTDLEVTTTDFRFSPNTWTVPAGEEISIDITNGGSVLHEWVLMRPGVNIDSEADLPETEEELLAEFVYVEDEVEAGAEKTPDFHRTRCRHVSSHLRHRNPLRCRHGGHPHRRRGRGGLLTRSWPRLRQ